MAQLRVTYLLICLINAEFSERAGIQQEFLSAKLRTGEAKQHWLDAAILVCHKSLRDFFRIYWSAKHKCDIEGCEWSLVTDGGLKPHRFGLEYLIYFIISILGNCVQQSLVESENLKVPMSRLLLAVPEYRAVNLSFVRCTRMNQLQLFFPRSLVNLTEKS